MFSWQHIVWLGICALMVAAMVAAAARKKPSLQQILTSACVISFLSELTKMISVIDLVPSSGGELLLPYLPMNHMPLHFCSIQILFIFYTRFTKNRQKRDAMLSFMYPTALCGAILALAMPSIFQTSITPDQAFTSLLSYQFFIFHSMLIALSILIVRSGEVEFSRKTMIRTMLIVIALGILSIYLNSLLASPTYDDGKLVSVDFMTNFFFTTQNPLGIRLTAIWQWWLYLIIITVLACLAVFLCYVPLLRKVK